MFDGVGFGYGNDTRVLDDVAFRQVQARRWPCRAERRWQGDDHPSPARFPAQRRALS